MLRPLVRGLPGNSPGGTSYAPGAVIQAISGRGTGLGQALASAIALCATPLSFSSIKSSRNLPQVLWCNTVDPRSTSDL